MRKYLFAAVVLGFIAMVSCKKTNPNYPDEPQIYYTGISSKKVSFFDTNLVFNIGVRFEDGDGDLGLVENDSTVYLLDYRSDTLYQRYAYPFPVIGDAYRRNKWLEGSFAISLSSAYFIPRLDSVHFAERKDTMVFRIYIEDTSGNKSNIITTDTIYISE